MTEHPAMTYGQAMELMKQPKFASEDHIEALQLARLGAELKLKPKRSLIELPCEECAGRGENKRCGCPCEECKGEGARRIYCDAALFTKEKLEELLEYRRNLKGIANLEPNVEAAKR